MAATAKELREYLGKVLEGQGTKASKAAKRAEEKLPALEERDKQRAERAQAREGELKRKYPSIDKGR